MRRITAIFLLLLLLAGAQTALAGAQQDVSGKTILVSQDFTEAVTEALVANTTLKVVRAIPADYTPDVHTYYLKKYWSKFAPLAQTAAGAITVASAWPEDPLYRWARRANIRIVHIDAIAPLDGSRAGVPLLNLSQKTGRSPVVWNSPGNTARIADIVASDLKMLFPEESKQIQANLNSFKKALFKLRSRFETAFSMADFFEVVALSTNYAYLTEEFGIVVIDSLVKPNAMVSQEELMKLLNRAKAGDVQVILSGREPKKEVRELLLAQGFHIVVLNNFSYDRTQPAKNQLVAFHEHNLDMLLKGLSSKP